MIRACLIMTVALVLSGTRTLVAQQPDASRIPTSLGYSIGADFLTAHPRGALKHNAGIGFGFGGHGLLATDSWGIAGVRIDAGMIRYGMETNRYPCGQFCYYEATTTNDIINLQVGGQLVMPRNLVLPYLGASYGMLWFTSKSQIDQEGDNPPPFRHDGVESGDATSSYMIAGGFYIPLRGALAGLTANLGARLFTGGYARYLTPKSLTQDANGNYQVTAYESKTDFLVVHIGVSSSMGVKKK